MEYINIYILMWKCENVEMWQWNLCLRNIVVLLFSLEICGLQLICNVLISMCLCLQSYEFMRGNRKRLQIEWSIIRKCRNKQNPHHSEWPMVRWSVLYKHNWNPPSPPPGKNVDIFYGPTNNTKKLYVSIASTWKLVIIWKWYCFWESSTLIFPK